MPICKTMGCSNEQVFIRPKTRQLKGYFRTYCTDCWRIIVNKSRKRADEQRWTNKMGYVMIRVDNNPLAVTEHSHIMEQKLGRKLIKGESVHHLNGIRTDNRPENLELWLGAHRSGQRASDIKCPHCGKPYYKE